MHKPQDDGVNNELLTSAELVDLMSVFSTAEEGRSGDASSLTQLFADGDQHAPSRKRPKVTRSRQLSDMRVMANALEYKLEDLKSRLYADRPEDGRFWERIAQRMLVEKRLAFRENARLHGLLRQQVSAVRALHFAFSKTPKLLVRSLPHWRCELFSYR